MRYDRATIFNGPRLEIHSKDEGQTIWFCLVAYRDALKKDLNTKYNNSPSWSQEDEIFLTTTIKRINSILDDLKRAGFEDDFEL